MNRDNEIAKAASESMTETLMSTPNYEFSPRATDLLECAYIKGAEWADEHPKSPWHSVADGDLPKEDKEYLVLVSALGVPAFFHYNVESNYWRNSRASFYKDWCVQDKITHWMEIPQPPKKCSQ